MNYRKIWESHYGPIPKDEQGRPYEIHHIDGNRKNNSVENLKCVSIEEHLKIHIEQEDKRAAILIADRIGITVAEIKLLKDSYNHSEKTKKKIVKANTENGHYERLSKTMKGNKFSLGNKLDEETLKKREDTRRERGWYKNPEETSLKKSKALKGRSIGFSNKILCPVCNQYTNAGNKRWHFDNCKKKSQI